MIARPLLAIALLTAGAAWAEGYDRLSGHGGPIMGVAVSADGAQALTASFDYTARLWDLADGAPVWLEGHRAAVNAGVFLPDGRVVTAGDDFAVLLWEDGAPTPIVGDSGETHQGKVMDLAVHGDLLASAGWDGAAGLWRLSGGGRLLEGHRGAVTSVAFLPEVGALLSTSADGDVRRWDMETGEFIRIEASHGFGINVLAVNESAGWFAYGGVDGIVSVRDLASGDEIIRFAGERKPMLAMALSPDGTLLATGDGQGYIMVVETSDWSLLREFRAAVHGPIWALAFLDDSRLLAGGLADEAAIWPIDARDGPAFADGPRAFHRDPAEMANGERQFMRKCAVCHTLTPDGARRAGPTLYGLFGRPSGSVADYRYSAALADGRVLWSAETIDKLFDLGPDHFTPGSKMPMQRIARPEDRQDLIEYLRAATAPAEETRP